MWGRVRVRGRRFLVSVVASERLYGGTIKQHHVCGLGSVPVAATPWQRHLFWCEVMRRLDALGDNQLSAAAKGFILDDIARRIPCPKPDDLHDVTAAWLEDKAREVAVLIAKGELTPLERTDRVLIHNSVAATLQDELARLDRWAEAARAAAKAAEAGLKAQ